MRYSEFNKNLKRNKHFTESGMHSTYVMNQNYGRGCSFTPENPNEPENALTQHWYFHCAQNTLPVPGVRTQISHAN